MSDLLKTENELKTLSDTIAKTLENFNLSVTEYQIKLAIIKKNIQKSETELKNISNNITEFDTRIDSQKFLAFFKKPYKINQLKNGKIRIYIPKWYPDFQIGWLVDENPNEEYYTFELNQYSAWLGEIPEDILKQVNFPEPINATVNGNIISFKEEDKTRIKNLPYLTDWKETTARITKGHEFEIINKIIESGRIPFEKFPISKEDKRESDKIKLRSYQKKAYQKFLETGATGLFFPTGAGKSFIAMKAVSELKGTKLIIVPTITLKEQWSWYIDEYIPEYKDEIVISTYQGFRDFETDYILTIYDECHYLPATTFSRLSTIKTKYRIGLSATPHREDGKESLIYTLTGYPIGVNWQEYMKEANRTYHPINIHVVKNVKWGKIRDLVDPNKKTIIFCDGIEMGKSIATRLQIPHIYGDTKDRMEMIQNNNVIVGSRVLDMGTSIPNLQRIIEVDFLFGSRQQELQRTGRLMHSLESNVRHDIIMTEKEFTEYGKRIWALREKGFTVKVYESG